MGRTRTINGSTTEWIVIVIGGMKDPQKLGNVLGAVTRRLIELNGPEKTAAMLYSVGTIVERVELTPQPGREPEPFEQIESD
jgi:hypothetical protein